MRMFLAAFLLCAVSLQAAGSCSNATIKGEYALRVSGTRPSAPGGPIEDFAGLLYRRYDGLGNFKETVNVKGAIAGPSLDVENIGTYQINEDCSGTSTTLPSAFRPFPIVARLIVVQDGEGIAGVTIAPAAFQISYSQESRIFKKQDDSAVTLAAIHANVLALARRLGLVPRDR